MPWSGISRGESHDEARLSEDQAARRETGAVQRQTWQSRRQKPTWTSLVLDALISADDFMSVPMLMAATSANFGQATAALHHLAKCKAAEAVVGGDGKLWWFATPSCDCRQYTVEERAPEEPGTRCRLKTGKRPSNKD